MRRTGRRIAILGAALCSAVVPATIGNAQSDGAPQDVTVADVKRFIDPTEMVNKFSYGFAANFLPGDIRLGEHSLDLFFALNSWSGFWTSIPVLDYSIPGADGPAGIGDVVVGAGVVAHEDLSRRITTIAITFEALAPTGDPGAQTGAGTWIFAPAVILAFNPTDEFPIYVIARYVHSAESLAGFGRDEEIRDDPSLEVRSLELTIQTVHILPKGFFVSAIPSFLFNFNQDFNVFSLGLGVGRALTPSFALNGSYLHQIAGEQTFNQAFTIQLEYIFGERKDR